MQLKDGSWTSAVESGPDGPPLAAQQKATQDWKIFMIDAPGKMSNAFGDLWDKFYLYSNFTNSVSYDRLLLQGKDPSRIPNRDKYIHEFVAVLRVCDQRDKYRKDYDYEVAEEELAKSKPPPVKCKMRLVARLIRALGDLRAIEATLTIGEFLLFPSDLTMDSPRLGDVPGRWALFQIGDDSLTVLREKMLAENPAVRKAAALTATEILGPRAAVELEAWIEQASTPEERDALMHNRVLFRLVAENSRTKISKNIGRNARRKRAKESQL